MSPRDRRRRRETVERERLIMELVWGYATMKKKKSKKGKRGRGY